MEQRHEIGYVTGPSELKWTQEFTPPQLSKMLTASHQVCKSLPLILALIFLPKFQFLLFFFSVPGPFDVGGGVVNCIFKV